MHRIAVLLILAACSKGQPDDCAIVRDKPSEALPELSKRYPNNPVKVAEIIEKCVAPSGDECDRIAKIVTAIPAMTPQIPQVKPFDYAKTCREAPPEFRRCLLPSYTLGHSDECQKVIAELKLKMQEPIVVRPEDVRDRAAATDCGFVAIYISQDGTWLATGRDAKSRCFAPRKAGALDQEWLESQLRKVKSLDCSPSSAELAGAADVLYSDVIATMDASVKVGLIDVGLSDPETLAVPLATAKAKGAPSECPVSVIAPAPAAASTPATPPPGTRGPDGLKNAPVLVITTSKLTLNVGTTTTEIATVAEAQQPGNKLEALTKALPPTKYGLLILQADQSTPATVINRVITTAKSAGYNDMLFAVKNQ